jgi:glutamate/tyrosine decarboxylase-like PLP-dependent enzyme
VSVPAAPPEEPAGPHRDELAGVLRLVAVEAERYLSSLDGARVRGAGADRAAESFGGAPMPERGSGAEAALTELLRSSDGLIASSGPRMFHFVTGGVTPAALGADWLTSLVDQNNTDWVGAPLASQIEAVSIRWLLDLFGLPADRGGVLTTGATMANFVALAAARRWWGLRRGVDVDADGLGGLPPVPVFASGYLHPSDTKALAMLGMGRGSATLLARDAAGRLDAAALEAELRALDGAPAIVIASAGEVNAGDFDPIDEMASLAHTYGAWLHVDGAFGLFAAVSPRTRHLVEGAARADSVIADGHKWLNVPYDCGFAFVRDPSLLPPAFAMGAAYLPDPNDPHPSFFTKGPEGSRRARSLAVWATLRAYGRDGYREVVERCLDLARHLAARVDEAPDLERLAGVPLNIVCFRYRPPGADETGLDELNRSLAAAILADGRVYFGSTRYEGRVAFRPAIVNWRTRVEDIDLLVDVTRELGARVAAGTS